MEWQSERLGTASSDLVDAYILKKGENMELKYELAERLKFLKRNQVV